MCEKFKSTLTIIALGALTVFSVSACGDKAPPATQRAVAPSATLIVTDARIWTGDPDNPWAEALAVDGDTVLAVASNADIALHATDTTIIIRAEGQMVVPGFIDSHVHIKDSGEALASVQLRDAKTPEEFTQRIADFAKTIEPGEWILGGGWDHENWGGELPRREWIDAVTGKNPVWIHRIDGHMALANGLALAAAGIDASTEEVEGGEIVRTADGAPTGVLKDNAFLLMQPAIPPPSDAKRDRELAAALDHLAANGVTTAHDMADFESLATFRRAHAADALITRIYSFMPLDQWQRVADDVAQNGRGDDWLKTGGLKGFMDGSLGSHTAAMIEPFTDTPDDRGFLINTLDDMRTWISDGDAAGLHVAVHAIGDQAIRDLLNIYAEVAADNGARDRRFRMEHAQHIHPDDIGRFAKQGVIASMQPYHAIDDGRWAERVIGPERARTTYAFNALMKSGADVAFGSDWYVAPASPLLGIHAAVTRQTLDGANPGGWIPQEKISVEDALKAYTVEGAYASFEEHRKGKLAPGMLADFVVLSHDITAIAAEQIKDVEVLRTVVGGNTVYKRR